LRRPDLPELAALPRDGADAPAFPEPWQAKAFAITVALHERGTFGWPEWAGRLATELARDGDDYWRAWLRALERLLAERGVADATAVEALAAAWARAAEATPHGNPIRLENAPPAP
jgi:nitrile hydratase accessory protein